MTMSKSHSADEISGTQLDASVPPNPANILNGGGDRDARYAEKIWDLRDLRDQSAGGVSALHQIQSFYEEAGLNVPAGVLKYRSL